jgi:hypothetical protein
MRGKWKALQALFLSDYSCACYVHFFAHRLQLALVVASREAVFVHDFFSNLNSLSMWLVHVNVMMNYKQLKQQKSHI